MSEKIKINKTNESGVNTHENGIVDNLKNAVKALLEQGQLKEAIQMREEAVKENILEEDGIKLRTLDDKIQAAALNHTRDLLKTSVNDALKQRNDLVTQGIFQRGHDTQGPRRLGILDDAIANQTFSNISALIKVGDLDTALTGRNIARKKNLFKGEEGSTTNAQKNQIEHKLKKNFHLTIKELLQSEDASKIQEGINMTEKCVREGIFEEGDIILTTLRKKISKLS